MPRRPSRRRWSIPRTRRPPPPRRLRAMLSAPRPPRPVEHLLAVVQAVAVAVGDGRVAAQVGFLVVGQPVVVGVDQERVAAGVQLVRVREAVAVGVPRLSSGSSACGRPSPSASSASGRSGAPAGPTPAPSRRPCGLAGRSRPASAAGPRRSARNPCRSGWWTALSDLALAVARTPQHSCCGHGVGLRQVEAGPRTVDAGLAARAMGSDGTVMVFVEGCQPSHPPGSAHQGEPFCTSSLLVCRGT